MRRLNAMTVAGLGFALLTTTAAGQPYINNTCATAVEIAPCDAAVPLRFQTPYTEDYERRPSCAGNYAYYNSVWVKFTATTQWLTVDLCTPSNAAIDDPLVSVYRATNSSSPCTSLVEIACLDNTPDCGDNSKSPRIQNIPLSVGSVYYIQTGVLGYSSSCSPCTNGDYALLTDCTPCELADPDAPPEDEYSTPVNDGCRNSPPVFAALRVGESRLGTSYYSGSSSYDEDWYRVVQSHAGPLEYTLSLQAQFTGRVRVLRAGEAGACDTTALVVRQFVGCEPPTMIPLILDSGVYYLVVDVDRCAAQVPQGGPGNEYLIGLTAEHGVLPMGACCTSGVCVQTDGANCTGPDGVYLGDGTSCALVTCFECPPGALKENEPLVCPGHGYTDNFNSGCDGSPIIGSSFIDVASGQTWCGESATFFDAVPPDASQNGRDSDWYRLFLTGVPTGQWRRIALNVTTEFPADVRVYYTDLGGLWGCPAGSESRLVRSQTVQPGFPAALSGCVVKRTGTTTFGDVLIVIRPIAKGTPREIPCGRRYRFTVNVEPCDSPGACCVTTTGGVSQGCQQTTAQSCAALGGRFLGENMPCDTACCPCPTGTTPENEPNCGDPNDSTNGGCNAAGFGYPFNTTALATPGSSVCGTTRFDGLRRDTDWYTYNHPGGDIVYVLTPSNFTPQAFILSPGADPNAPCTGLGVVASGTGTACEPLIVTAAARPPGTYWLWAGPTTGVPISCGASYVATIDAPSSGAGGRCCVPAGDPDSPYAGCVILSQAACLSAGGVWGGDGSTCDPNPCPGCPVACGPDATPEGEPNCNSTSVNGGCDASPAQLGSVLGASGAAVCGTTRRPTSGTADTDWYVYQHSGGLLAWAIRAEFVGLVRIVGPVYNATAPCCSVYERSEFEFDASCATEFGALAAAPGRYHIVVTSRAANGPIACGAKYELRVWSGASGACCIEGTCEMLPSAACTAAGGIWRGAGATCQSGACFCTGDMDCDGDVDFFDIDPFVAALDPGATPDCPRMNADCDDDGDVDFYDIDPFVVLLGSSCE